jgi:acyl carrier protein
MISVHSRGRPRRVVVNIRALRTLEMDVEAQVRAQLVDFVVTNYLFGDESRAPGDDDSLVEGGIIDSTGVMELIEFLESQFGIEVSDDDTVPRNLDTVANLTQFVLRKQAPAGQVVGTEERLSG